MLAPFCQCLKFVILVEFPHIILKLTTVQPLSRQIVISSYSLALFLHPINHQGCYKCSTQTWITKTTISFLAHPNNWQQVLTVRQTIVFESSQMPSQSCFRVSQVKTLDIASCAQTLQYFVPTK